MQLNLVFLDRPDLPPSRSPTAPLAMSWDQIDESSRIAALEILTRLIARMLSPTRRGRQAMNERAKITTSHLSRQAIVYLRQSSAAQVENNRESTERQYALAA
jgi:hypothetical protein